MKKSPTQAECDAANSLREFESAHAKYMSLSIFTEAGRQAKLEMKIARQKHTVAVESAHPNWSVI